MDLKTLQSFCQTLPGTTEDLKWGNDLCFLVGQKMYAVLSIHEDTPPAISIKTTPELFEVLTQREGIRPAPYLARYKWITLNHLNVIPEDELFSLIQDSYQMILAKLPKKLRPK